MTLWTCRSSAASTLSCAALFTPLFFDVLDAFLVSAALSLTAAASPTTSTSADTTQRIAVISTLPGVEMPTRMDRVAFALNPAPPRKFRSFSLVLSLAQLGDQGAEERLGVGHHA